MKENTGEQGVAQRRGKPRVRTQTLAGPFGLAQVTDMNYFRSQ
jgi:hypothetical protein